MNNNSNKPTKVVEHHRKLELCKNRPAYRQGRKLTAVKTYTITSESQHLFIYGVPKVNLRNELKRMCISYGQVLALHTVENYKCELFTECYHVQYQRIQSARIAKRLIDNRSFYGGVLHVCYAPEFESVEETKAKLLQRTKDVMKRLQPQIPTTSFISEQNSYKDIQSNSYIDVQSSSYINMQDNCFTSTQNESAVVPLYNGNTLKRKHSSCDPEEDPMLKAHNSSKCSKQLKTSNECGDVVLEEASSSSLTRKRTYEIPVHYLKSVDEPSTSRPQTVTTTLIPHQVANKNYNLNKKIIFRKKPKLDI